MLTDFLNSLNCVFPEEKADFEIVQTKLNATDSFAFMPIVTLDLYPIHIIEETNIQAGSINNVYILPMGTHDLFIKNEIEELLKKFYNDDDTELSYGASIEEIIPLKSPDISYRLGFDDSEEINVIYVNILLKSGKYINAFLVADTIENCWTNIIEKYDIPLKWLIDSHKGMGDWFECTELYTLMKKSIKPSLLPDFYFKGKYISHIAPSGFELLHKVTENEPNACISEIYKTYWKV